MSSRAEELTRALNRGRANGYLIGVEEVQLALDEAFGPETKFEVVLTATGDRAEADSAEAILTAAATLVDDVVVSRGSRQGLIRSLRETLYVTENGTYAGILTAFARRGERSI